MGSDGAAPLPDRRDRAAGARFSRAGSDEPPATLGDRAPYAAESRNRGLDYSDRPTPRRRSHSPTTSRKSAPSSRQPSPTTHRTAAPSLRDSYGDRYASPHASTSSNATPSGSLASRTMVATPGGSTNGAFDIPLRRPPARRSPSPGAPLSRPLAATAAPGRKSDSGWGNRLGDGPRSQFSPVRDRERDRDRWGSDLRRDRDRDRDAGRERSTGAVPGGVRPGATDQYADRAEATRRSALPAPPASSSRTWEPPVPRGNGWAGSPNRSALLDRDRERDRDRDRERDGAGPTTGSSSSFQIPYLSRPRGMKRPGGTMDDGEQSDRSYSDSRSEDRWAAAANAGPPPRGAVDRSRSTSRSVPDSERSRKASPDGLDRRRDLDERWLDRGSGNGIGAGRRYAAETASSVRYSRPPVASEAPQRGPSLLERISRTPTPSAAARRRSASPRSRSPDRPPRSHPSAPDDARQAYSSRPTDISPGPRPKPEASEAALPYSAAATDERSETPPLPSAPSATAAPVHAGKSATPPPRSLPPPSRPLSRRSGSDDDEMEEGELQEEGEIAESDPPAIAQDRRASPSPPRARSEVATPPLPPRRAPSPAVQPASPERDESAAPRESAAPPREASAPQLPSGPPVSETPPLPPPAGDTPPFRLEPAPPAPLPAANDSKAVDSMTPVAPEAEESAVKVEEEGSAAMEEADAALVSPTVQDAGIASGVAIEHARAEVDKSDRAGDVLMEGTGNREAQPVEDEKGEKGQAVEAVQSQPVPATVRRTPSTEPDAGATIDATVTAPTATSAEIAATTGSTEPIRDVPTAPDTSKPDVIAPTQPAVAAPDQGAPISPHPDVPVLASDQASGSPGDAPLHDAPADAAAEDNDVPMHEESAAETARVEEVAPSSLYPQKSAGEPSQPRIDDAQELEMESAEQGAAVAGASEAKSAPQPEPAVGSSPQRPTDKHPRTPPRTPPSDVPEGAGEAAPREEVQADRNVSPEPGSMDEKHSPPVPKLSMEEERQLLTAGRTIAPFAGLAELIGTAWADFEERHGRLSAALFDAFSERDERRKERIIALRQQYKAFHVEWKAHCRRLDEIKERQHQNKNAGGAQAATAPQTPSIDSAGMPFYPEPITPGPSITGGRSNRRGTGASVGMFGYSDTVRSEAEFLEILASLETADLRDPDVRAARTAAVVPDMVIDESERREVIDLALEDERYRVDDPVATFGINAPLDVWTEQEVETFCKRYTLHPKQFGKIAQDLPDKSVAQCVLFFYRMKNTIDFRSLSDRRGRDGRRKKSKKRPEGGKGSSLLSNLNKKPRPALAPPREDDLDDEDDEEPSAPVSPRPAMPIDGVEATGDKMDVDGPEPEQAREQPAEALPPVQESATPRRIKIVSSKTPKLLTEDLPSEGMLEAAEALGALAAFPPSQTPEPTGRAGTGRELSYGPSNGRSGAGRARKARVDLDTVPTEEALAASPFAAAPEVEAQPGPPGDKVKPKRKATTSSYWTLAERAEFQRLLGLHGPDWRKIAAGLGNKTWVQCRNWFQNQAKKNNLVDIVNNADLNTGRDETPYEQAEAPLQPAVADPKPGFLSATSAHLLPALPAPTPATDAGKAGMQLRDMLNEEAKPVALAAPAREDWFASGPPDAEEAVAETARPHSHRSLSGSHEPWVEPARPSSAPISVGPTSRPIPGVVPYQPSPMVPSLSAHATTARSDAPARLPFMRPELWHRPSAPTFPAYANSPIPSASPLSSTVSSNPYRHLPTVSSGPEYFAVKPYERPSNSPGPTASTPALPPFSSLSAHGSPRLGSTFSRVPTPPNGSIRSPSHWAPN